MLLRVVVNSNLTLRKQLNRLGSMFDCVEIDGMAVARMCWDS